MASVFWQGPRTDVINDAAYWNGLLWARKALSTLTESEFHITHLQNEGCLCERPLILFLLCCILYHITPTWTQHFQMSQKLTNRWDFSLYETPKEGGNLFGFTSVCLRAPAWNFHCAVDEKSIKIWLWIIHLLWIGWVQTGNKNTGESRWKQCWTLDAFTWSCGVSSGKGWSMFHLQNCVPAVLSWLHGPCRAALILIKWVREWERLTLP